MNHVEDVDIEACFICLLPLPLPSNRMESWTCPQCQHQMHNTCMMEWLQIRTPKVKRLRVEDIRASSKVMASCPHCRFESTARKLLLQLFRKRQEEAEDKYNQRQSRVQRHLVWRNCTFFIRARMRRRALGLRSLHHPSISSVDTKRRRRKKFHQKHHREDCEKEDYKHHDENNDRNDDDDVIFIRMVRRIL